MRHQNRHPERGHRQSSLGRHPHGLRGRGYRPESGSIRGRRSERAEWRRGLSEVYGGGSADGRKRGLEFSFFRLGWARFYYSQRVGGFGGFGFGRGLWIGLDIWLLFTAYISYIIRGNLSLGMYVQKEKLEIIDTLDRTSRLAVEVGEMLMMGSCG